MSFLAGRLAGKEAAYFFQETKHAVNRLAEKTPAAGKKIPPTPGEQSGIPADVLPEILRHSLPSKIFGPPPDPSSLSKSSKWALQSDPNAAVSVSSEALNPLRNYLSLPQVTFGPKRWELPDSENSVMASTANEMRRDRYSAPVNPEKVKAAAEGLKYVGKAFAVASIIIFGGATFVFGMAASKLDIHNSDDIRSKSKDLVQPKLENIREQLMPIRIWVEDISKKWRVDDREYIKEKPIVKELSKVLGAKS